MLKIESIIDLVVNGKNVSDALDEVLDENNDDALDEYIRGTARRPRMRRFARKGKAFDPYTGKRKDPRKRLKARRIARKARARRRIAAKKLARSAIGKIAAKRRGKLIARMARTGRIRRR